VLREAGIAGDANVLTDDGRDLLEAYKPLGEWAKRWARRRPRASVTS